MNGLMEEPTCTNDCVARLNLLCSKLKPPTIASMAPLSLFKETNAELARGICPKTHSPLSFFRNQICSPVFTGADCPVQRIALVGNVIFSPDANKSSAPALDIFMTAAGINGSEFGNFFRNAIMVSLSQEASPFFHKGSPPR